MDCIFRVGLWFVGGSVDGSIETNLCRLGPIEGRVAQEKVIGGAVEDEDGLTVTSGRAGLIQICLLQVYYIRRVELMGERSDA